MNEQETAALLEKCASSCATEIGYTAQQVRINRVIVVRHFTPLLERLQSTEQKLLYANDAAAKGDL